LVYPLLTVLAAVGALLLTLVTRVMVTLIVIVTVTAIELRQKINHLLAAALLLAAAAAVAVVVAGIAADIDTAALALAATY
jgi:hypothetical protein